MNIEIRQAVLVFCILAMAIQGCTEREPTAPILEKPVSMTEILGPDGTAGPIELNNWQHVIRIPGPGMFISALVSKSGGSGASPNGPIKTSVRLIIDREEVVLRSFELADWLGIARHNYSGVTYFQGEQIGEESFIETLALGFPQRLLFRQELVLSVKVDDPKVEKVFFVITHTKEDIGVDEGGPGGDSEPTYP